MNRCSLFLCASSPPSLAAALRSHLRHLCAFNHRLLPKPSIRRPQNQPFGYGCLRVCAVHSLVDSVMKEFNASRRSKRVRARAKVSVESNGKLSEYTLEKQAIQKGFLLEFEKDSNGIVLAVAQKRDGKKWVVSDQCGITSSVGLQEITLIIPNEDKFGPTEISDFIQRAHDKLDLKLVEHVWTKLQEKNKSVTAMELAEMIFGSADPINIYCSHLLLSRNKVYFTVLRKKGAWSVYGPQPTMQNEEILGVKLAKEAADREGEEFVQLLLFAKARPKHAKPPKSVWNAEEKIKYKIDSLEAFALDACKNNEQRKTAGMILKAIGLTKVASSAVSLLIDVGYFPVHVNLDLLKLNLRTDHSHAIMLAAESRMQEPSDQDEIDRRDLTGLKVYAIDVDEADELDDALGATRLQDGRIKVWIHVADPTSLVPPRSILDREAMKRGTSIFLPTATYPMFPVKLAMEGMSLKQGTICKAVTVSVVLHSDGSIAEYAVFNSLIRPTYMLTYETTSELLHLNLEEEVELKILSEAAALRTKWRRLQGACDTSTLQPRIKVANPEDPEPSINVYVENQAEPAMRLVSEMMLLCGEVIATFGSSNNIPLPYRGQPQSDIDMSGFSHFPEGPVKSSALVKVMRAAELDFRRPIRHGVLGLPGYVQFTSPIRRYMDLLAHYQVKAFLRGDSFPFSAGQMEGLASSINMQLRVVKRLSECSLRYWTIEFLRRQPKNRTFRALILRFIKNRNAALLLMEVGLQASACVSIGRQIGDEVLVSVEQAYPRDDVLSLKEVI